MIRVLCPLCKKPLAEDDKYCPQCGTARVGLFNGAIGFTVVGISVFTAGIFMVCCMFD